MRRFPSNRLAPWCAGLAIVAGLIQGVPSLADDPKEEPERRSVLARAAASGKAGTFVAAVVLADLIAPLRGDGSLTVLVPTDEAFAKLPSATRQALFGPGGTEKLRALLKYHVLAHRVLAKQITGDPRPKTLTGERWTVASNDRGIAINKATVVEADVLARNGVIHFIDAVLQPPAPDLLTLTEKAEHFGVLLEALTAAGLDDTLRRDGPFTVFAPTDEAFMALGNGTLASLLEKSNRAKLREILKYHVVAGKITARDAVVAGEARTLQGGPVSVSIKGGKLKIGPANATATDLEASNGIIHVIDRVLIPDGNSRK